MPPQEHWHSPSNLSDQDLLRMQQDARQRVRRMQQQANEAMRRGGVPRQVAMATNRPAPARHPSEPPQRPPEPHADPTHAGSPLAPLFRLLQDEDRMLILLLLILLGSEKSDPALLLALVYLLM